MANTPAPQGPAAADAAPVAAPPPRRRSPRRFILPALLLVAGGGAAIWMALHAGLESTDDAQIEASIVPVPARAGGTITAIHFHDNDRVDKGALLAEIDDAPARAQLAQAEANLVAAQAQARAADSAAEVAGTNARSNKAAAEAGLSTASSASRARSVQTREGRAAVKTARVALAQANADLERYQALFEGGAVARAQLEVAQTAAALAASTLASAEARVASLDASADTASAQIGEASARVEQTRDVDTQVALAAAQAKAAHAQVEVARASVDLARLSLEHTRIYAPQGGIISKKGIEVGQMVQPGQPVAQLVTDDIWVTANYKETDLTRMKIGQPVALAIDAYPDIPLRGHVESFSGATGARFALLPPDNATGNFTKVVQRLPVRIHLDDVPSDVALWPGLSVVVTVDTRDHHEIVQAASR